MNLQNKARYRRVVFFARSQEVSESLLFHELCVGWKLSIITIGEEFKVRMSLVEKK